MSQDVESCIKPVGAGLLANALIQSTIRCLIHRIREQALPHVFWLPLDRRHTLDNNHLSPRHAFAVPFGLLIFL